MPTPLAANIDGTAGMRCRGFGIVELMVAMTLSLVLLGGVVALFASARKSYESNEHLARIQENGRFALDQITRDIRAAGYTGCAKDTPFASTLVTTTNPLVWDFRFPAYGFQSTGTAWLPALDATLAPSAAAVNSDVLVLRTPDPDLRVRRTTTLMATPSADLVVTPAAPALAPGDSALITDCTSMSVFEVTSDSAGVVKHAGTTKQSAINGGLISAGNLSASLGYAFREGSMVLRMQSVVYYVRQSGIAANGNSLWRRRARDAPEEMVEGVDSLQVVYGVDTNADRVVDAYKTAAAIAAGDWGGVVSIRIGLLLRSVEQYGKSPDVEHKVIGQTILAAADNRERLTLATTVALRNAAL